MSARPPALVRVVFFAILLLAIPVAIYHLSSGRPAQATMAFGAALAGALVAGGWLVPTGDELAPGDRTAAFLDELYDLHAHITTTCWPADLSRLLDIAGRLLTAATATGGPAFAVFNPPHERPGDPPGVLLFNRLAALRYHRSDAHAAAWAARGLTAAEIVALPADTPLRQDIEADTNRRAALPYEALPPNERLRFLAELAALA